jgi:hypothetical protein
MSRVSLSTAERELLLMARPLQAIQRPAFRGHPFRLAGETCGSFRHRKQFPDDLVIGLVERDLLTVTQCAHGLQSRDGSGTTFSRPFSCILSKAGLEQRAYLIADGAIRPANDSDSQERVA